MSDPWYADKIPLGPGLIHRHGKIEADFTHPKNTGVVGPPGATGPAGPTGPTGPAGTPGFTGFYAYLWNTSGTVADPTSGHVTVNNAGGQNRILVISETDATAAARSIGVISPGDNITLTDNATPVTTWVRYVVTGPGTDMGTWWQIPMVRTDGTTPSHANNAPVRVYASFASLAPMTIDQLADVPPYTTADAGKSLVVQGDGTLAWQVVTGGPSAILYDSATVYDSTTTYEGL